MASKASNMETAWSSWHLPNSWGTVLKTNTAADNNFNFQQSSFRNEEIAYGMKSVQHINWVSLKEWSNIHLIPLTRAWLSSVLGWVKFLGKGSIWHPLVINVPKQKQVKWEMWPKSFSYNNKYLYANSTTNLTYRFKSY